jgi:SAM-dependent methyltransferase
VDLTMRPRELDASTSDTVRWHELECGSYRADLPLWRRLAATAAAGDGEAPVLDVGCGTGRVAVDLAHRGHAVTAVDIDPELLRELERRAAGLPVAAVQADARALALPRRDHGLCIVAMQSIQLFGGAAQRARFLARAREHLRPGALIACAIVTEIEPFAPGDGGPTPDAERQRIGGRVYESRARAVRVRARTIVLERDRRVIADPPQAGARGPRAVRDVVVLARLSAAQLEREGAALGLAPQRRLRIPQTVEHVGSEVVVLRA